jgi:Leucine rich repeat
MSPIWTKAATPLTSGSAADPSCGPAKKEDLIDSTELLHRAGTNQAADHEEQQRDKADKRALTAGCAAPLSSGDSTNETEDVSSEAAGPDNDEATTDAAVAPVASQVGDRVAANTAQGTSLANTEDDRLLDAMEQQRQDDDLVAEDDAKNGDTSCDFVCSSSPRTERRTTVKNITNLVPSSECLSSRTNPTAAATTSLSRMVMTEINQADKKAVLAERSSATRAVRRSRGGGLASSLTSSSTSSNTAASTAMATIAAELLLQGRRSSNLGYPASNPNPLVEEKIGIALRSSGYGRAARLPPNLEGCKGEAMKTTVNNTGKRMPREEKQGHIDTERVDAPGAFAVSTTMTNSDALFQESFASVNSSRSVFSKHSNDGTAAEVVAKHGLSMKSVDSERGECGLAVAEVVDGNGQEQDPRLPAALEFDPDAKPARQTARMFRRRAVCVVVGLLIPALIAIGMAIAFWPRSQSRYAKIKDALSNQRLDIELSGPHGYEEALDWITFNDPLQLKATDSSLTQRFLLAATYFATQSKNTTWKYCLQPAPGQDEFCIGPQQRRGMRWLSAHSECMWIGVGCERGIIKDISLEQFGLRGLFPHSLAALDSLKTIDLSQNDLSGTIPSSLFELSLEGIRLSGNNLSGAINGFERLTDIMYIDVTKNQLTGIIPELTSQALFDLSLSFNKLRGTIPSSLANLEDLEVIRCGHNTLSGTIPPSIGQLQRLRYLQLHDNWLDGSIPESLFSCKELMYVDLSGNSIHGIVGSGLGGLLKLQYLDLSGNDLSGTLPAGENLLTDLYIISVSQNRFVGTFPLNLCSSSMLTFVQADCSHGGSDYFHCDCCTSCCSRQNGDCSDVAHL